MLSTLCDLTADKKERMPMITKLEKPPLDELVHFGVLGMKWGKHKKAKAESLKVSKARAIVEKAKEEVKNANKAMNKDSMYGLKIPPRKTMKRLSNAVREHEYARQDLKSAKILEKVNSKKKSEAQLSREAKYKKDGMGDDEAAVAAYQYLRTKKILIGVGSVALAAGVGYAAYKIHDARVDKIIKSGTLLQNISTDSTKGIRDAFYSSSNKLDNVKYKGLYGKHLTEQGKDPIANLFGEGKVEGAFKKEIKVLSDIKQASHKNAQKTLEELIKSDPEFARGVDRDIIQGTMGIQARFAKIANKAKTGLDKGQTNKSLYEMFNIALVDHSPETQPLIDKYYAALSSKGYNAIKDINDSKYSGYKAINPIIAFNTKGVVDVIDVKRLADKEIAKAGKIAYAHIIGTDLMKQGAAIAGGMMGLKVMSKTNTQKQNLKKTERYRKQHPGTKMTNTEIIRIIERSK